MIHASSPCVFWTEGLRQSAWDALVEQHAHAWPLARHEFAGQLQERQRLLTAHRREIVQECLQAVTGG